MKRYLVLENGEVFAGLAFGAPCDTVGELVFTTGMNGYIETLTDPSYCGQIVLQTFPLIGNYGIIPADFEGKCCVRGYVVREQCQTPSNFRCEETLDAFLKANNIPGIAGIDTRAVTRILREAGTMNAAICDTVPDDLAPLRAYRITDPVPQVTTPEPYTLRPEGDVLHRVALIDYGAKRNIARELCRRGCAIAENEILKHKVAQHHDDLAADGAQQREAKGLFAAGAEDQRRDHGRTPFDDERAGRVAHVAGDHIRQTGAETGSHAAVERAGQQGGEHDHDVAGVEIAAGHGRDLDDERRHAAQSHEHGGVDEISEFLVHNITLFLLVAQGYDIRHK